MAKEKKDYWFKAKKYGWGWGLPGNRQGAIAYTVFVAVWAAALIWYVASYSGVDEPPLSANLTLAAIIGLDVIGLVYVAAKHGEPPKWRWGSKDAKRSKTTES